MTSSFQVRILIFSREVKLPFLSLTELGEKSSTTIILGNFVGQTITKCYWDVVLGKCFSFVKI